MLVRLYCLWRILLKKDVNDVEESYHLGRMTDIQLYDYFITAGYLADPDECIGIVKIIPKDCIDGQTLADLIDFPLDLEFYLNELEK